MAHDLSSGSVFKNLISFSIPFFFSYFLQTLYGMADLYFAGQFNDSQVITAISAGSQFMHMLTVIVVGLAMGTTVHFGRSSGAKNNREVSLFIVNTVYLFTALSIILTVLLLFFNKSIVLVIKTPQESVSDTISYLRICFLGIPFIVFYNIISAIFRGTGDSKTPMYFIGISCVINIVLDYYFMAKLKMGSSGAALATVLSQTLSVIFSFIAIYKRKLLRIKKSDMIFSLPHIKSILDVGFPVALQDGFIQVSFLLITVIANMRGVKVAAAVGIVEKIITFLFLIPSSMLASVTAIASQNFGAKKYQRAKQTLYCGIMIASGFGLIFSIIFQFASLKVLSVFCTEPDVAELGRQYLSSYVFDCIFAGIHFCFSAYFCAIGKSILSFIHNALSIVLVRVPGAYLASKFWPQSLYPMGWAAPLGSLLSALICTFAFCFISKKLTKSFAKQNCRTQGDS